LEKASKVVPVLGGLAVCAAGGGICAALHTPLPWMLGSIFGMGAAQLAGARFQTLPGGRDIGMLVVGVSLGLYFTSPVVREVSRYWPWFIFLGFAAIGFGAASALVLMKLGGVDRATAYFGSMPGGASEMATMGEDYGAKTHLNQLATINAPEPRLIVVTPFDKGSMGDIEKAIKASDLGLNPMNDGKIIRIPIPELTQERRRDLVKHVKKIAEEFRVSMRNHRRDANDMLKELLKEKEISEDDHRHAHDKVQALTDAGIVQVDQILKAKEDEIMAV